VLERDDLEHPIPSQLHGLFVQIVDAFLRQDFELRAHPIIDVEPIDVSTAKSIADNIASYGDSLARLNPATWERSIYRWMDGYWQFIVDLSTSGEPVSDLALHARLDCVPGSNLEVQSVYVP